MAEAHQESREAKKYLTVVKRGRPHNGRVDFLFDPPLSKTTPISGKTQLFIQKNIVDKGGDFKIEGSGEDIFLTGIVIPQSLERKTIVELFKLLERDGICDKNFPNEPSPERKEASVSDLLQHRGKTRTEIRTVISETESTEHHEGQKFSIVAEIQKSEKVGKDARIVLDVMTKAKGVMRAHEKSEIIVFEYNGVEKKITTNRQGSIKNLTLYFKEVADPKAKLRCWPQKFPGDVTEYPLTLSESEEPQSLAEQIAEMSEQVRDATEKLGKKRKGQSNDEFYFDALGALELLNRAKTEKEKQTLREEYEQKLSQAAAREHELEHELKEVVENSVQIPKPQTPREIMAARSMFEESLDDRNEPDLNVLRLLLSQKEPLVIGDNQMLVLPGNEQLAVMCDIVVEPGGVLYVKSGCQLYFDEGGGIICRGLIKAVGNTDKPIVFSNLKEGKKWKNISLEGGDENLLRHCIIQGGSGRIYTLDSENMLAFIDESGRNPQKRLPSGGGLACLNGCEKTVLTGLIVRDCQVEGEGGGIWNYHASPKLSGIECAGNKAMFGGGMHMNGGEPELKAVHFNKNNAGIHGGGLAVINGSPLLETCVFQKNTAKTGAGFYVNTNKNTMPNLQNCSMTENIAEDRGGAAYLHLDYDQSTGEAYHPLIEGGNVMRNQAKQGGGFYIYHNIPKRSYDFLHHDFGVSNMAAAGNTPDDVREEFRSR